MKIHSLIDYGLKSGTHNKDNILFPKEVRNKIPISEPAKLLTSLQSRTFVARLFKSTFIVSKGILQRACHLIASLIYNNEHQLSSCCQAPEEI
jgi:hypothetical protein